MLYRNKVTGAELEVKSQISGGGWEPAEKCQEPKEAAPEKAEGAGKGERKNGRGKK